jgi:DNA mismatch endonuclease (patch repair protein)
VGQWPGNAALEQTTFGRLSRSDLMARVRSHGNKTTEGRLAALLRKSQIKGWRRHQPLPGRPDFVWKSAKVAVFVDGCFWHGHTCRNTAPQRNVSAWRGKILKTKLRDRRVVRILRAKGWRVMRIWECQLSRQPEKRVAAIRALLS